MLIWTFSAINLGHPFCLVGSLLCNKYLWLHRYDSIIDNENVYRFKVTGRFRRLKMFSCACSAWNTYAYIRGWMCIT